jgi:hypothetical protein
VPTVSGPTRAREPESVRCVRLRLPIEKISLSGASTLQADTGCGEALVTPVTPHPLTELTRRGSTAFGADR